MPILPVPPAFPVPVLPQVFDTSLSYYELLAKLTETINAISVQVNQNTANIAALSAAITNISEAVSQLQETVGELPAEFQQLSDDLAAEIRAREDADNSLAQQLAGWANIMQTQYVSFADLENDYLVNGITFEILTQQEYDALTEYVAKRVYFIWNGNTIVIQYHDTTSDAGTRLAFGTSATGLFNPELRGVLNGGVFNFIPESEVE